MKIFFTLLIAAALFASCSEPTLKIPEPTQYNITFKVYCDSCGATYQIDLYSMPMTEFKDSISFDTIGYSGSEISGGFFDNAPDIGQYRASIYIDGVLTADTVINNIDTTQLYLTAGIQATLK